MCKTKVTLASFFVCCGLFVSSAFAAPTEAKKVFFSNLKDGQEVTSPLKIEMGVTGVTVAKAGEVVEGTGHHHLIVDGQALKSGDIVPKDETHIHFGQGQTETSVELKPGKHTLTLQFADGAHRSYGQELSTTITVDVKG